VIDIRRKRRIGRGTIIGKGTRIKVEGPETEREGKGLREASVQQTTGMRLAKNTQKKLALLATIARRRGITLLIAQHRQGPMLTRLRLAILLQKTPVPRRKLNDVGAQTNRRDGTKYGCLGTSLGYGFVEAYLSLAGLWR